MKPKKSGIGIMQDLMRSTRCERCGTTERTVTYTRTTRTGSMVRTTRCINCK